jgi:hypothetical protein
MGPLPLPSGDTVCFANPKYLLPRQAAIDKCKEKGFDGLAEGRTNEDRIAISKLEQCNKIHSRLVDQTTNNSSNIRG